MNKLMTVLAVSVPIVVLAQSPTDVRRKFEAGQYQDVVDAVAASQSGPDLQFLAGQSLVKLDRDGEAKEAFGKLVARGQNDAWHFVGQSAVSLIEGRTDEALGAASRAVTVNARLPEAHYQLGVAYGHKQDYAKAAAAFDRAIELNPSFAYAHYHAGLSYYRVKRIDRMATHFEAFLKLAPEAPERPEVESIMRTVRGR